MRLYKHLLLLGLFISALKGYSEIRVDTKDVTCHEKKDGEATINVVGTTGTFQYTITRSCYLFFDCDERTQMSNKFTGLEKGDYQVVVKDMDTDCEYSKTFTINEPDELRVSVGGGGTFRFCDNQSPPTVTLTASGSGGTAPYTYSWPGGQLTVSGSGTYTCTVTDKNGCTATSSVQVVMIPIVCSRDPNDIVGPAGVGPEKWVAKSASQTYTIRFENDPEFATAPAQEVRINQKLDPHINMYSLRLGNFGFGNFTFPVPPNKTYYSARVNVVDSLGVMVDVVAGIDVTKGEVFWIFKSVDPATGLTPTDASLGFLLVNDALRRGEGYVSYMVKAANNTVTGDSIRAMANIVFDINEAILTPEIFNTIDATPPASQVDPVPAEIRGDYMFTVSASDEGSGVESYDLFISENDGPFTLLAARIAVDSAITFRGTEGSHYAMYSVVRDSVGNVETAPATGDVSFFVPQSTFVRLNYPVGGEQFCAGDSILVRWSSHDVADVNLYYSGNDGLNYLLIAEAIAAEDTSYYWVLPETLPQGTSYKILLVAASDSTIRHATEGRFTVNRAPEPNIISSRGHTLCYGDSTVLSVTPNAFPSYSWSTGETASEITVKDIGIYGVTLVDYNGCRAQDTIYINSFPAMAPPVVTAGSSTSFCAGGSVELFAPEGFEGYKWSTGEVTRSIVVVNSGDYSVLVTNVHGCTSPSSEPTYVTVHDMPERPIVTADGPLTICDGDSVVLFAPSGFTGYSWLTGDTTRHIVVTQSGTYSVTVTSAEGCLSLPSSDVTVAVLPAPLKPTITANGPLSFCEGGSVILSAPSGYDNYIWSTGDTTQHVIVSSSGDYSVAVGLENGCLSPSSDVVSVDVFDSLPTPEVTANGSLTFCEGGSVTLIAPDGFDHYLWSNGDSTQTITVADAGNYSVIVSTNSGCMSPPSEEVTVTVLNSMPKPEIDVLGSLTFCQGDSVILSGPSGYDNYLWSTGDSTQTIVVFNSGQYLLNVTLASGCVVPPSDTVTVISHEMPPVPVVEVSGPLSFCTGDSVVLSAPEGYVAYLWSTGANTRSITVTSSGNYTVTVVSENGCVSPVSSAVAVSVSESAPTPAIQADGPLTFCEGGSVTLSTTEIYDGYLWSTGDTTSTITVSASGYIFVEARLGVGCVSPLSDTVVVTVIPLPAVPTITSSGPLTFCPGDSVILSGPDGYSAYVWSTGDSTQAIVVTTTENVFLTVFNSSGCERTSEVISTFAVDNIPPSLIVPLDMVVSANTDSCKAFVNVPVPVVSDNCGGYTLTNSHNHSDDASGVYPAGLTTIVWTVTDASGNMAMDSMRITVIDNIAPVLTLPASITVNADADSCGAEVIIPVPTVSDNCQVLSLMNSFNGMQDASGFYPVGTTTVVWTVTDAGGNMVMDSIYVTVIDNIAPVLTLPASITIIADTDSCGAGVIIPVPTISDNCQVLSLVNSFNGTEDASGFYPVGTTTVVWTVMDAGGNVAMDSMYVTIIDGTAPQVSNCPADIIVNAGGNGSATVTWAPPVFNDACGITSVTSNYNPGDSFAAGTTTVVYTATDHHGNTSTCSFAVTVISSPLIVTLSAAEYSCGFNVSCHGAADGQVTATVTGGVAPYSYLWSDGQTGAVGIFGAGTFTVTVTDANGTVVMDSITLTQPDALASFTQVTQNITCHGANNGAAKVLLSGGCAPYAYLWSNGQTTAEATGLSGGMHTVSITDVNGCSIIDTVYLTQPAALMVNAGENRIVHKGYGPTACTTLSASVSGGNPVYTYLWSTGAKTPQIQVCPGSDMIYTVTVTDKNGCTATDVVKVCVEDVSCKIAGLIPGVQICVSSSILPWIKVPMCVPEILVPIYLSSGATLGSCDGSMDACEDDSNVSVMAFTQVPDEMEQEISVKDDELFLKSYPNPFRQSTNIVMWLPGVKTANLKVYDLDGIEVAEIFDGQVEVSKQIELEYTPKPDITSGVYFLRLVTDNGKVIMKKIVFIK